MYMLPPETGLDNSDYFEPLDVTGLKANSRVILQQAIAEPLRHNCPPEGITRDKLTPARYGTVYRDCRVTQVLVESNYALVEHEGEETLVPTSPFIVTTESGLVYAAFFNAYREKNPGFKGWLRSMFYRKM
jgi:hypothetical protein